MLRLMSNPWTLHGRKHVPLLMYPPPATFSTAAAICHVYLLMNEWKIVRDNATPDARISPDLDDEGGDEASGGQNTSGVVGISSRSRRESRIPARAPSRTRSRRARRAAPAPCGSRVRILAWRSGRKRAVIVIIVIIIGVGWTGVSVAVGMGWTRVAVVIRVSRAGESESSRCRGQTGEQSARHGWEDRSPVRCSFGNAKDARFAVIWKRSRVQRLRDALGDAEVVSLGVALLPNSSSAVRQCGSDRSRRWSGVGNLEGCLGTLSSSGGGCRRSAFVRGEGEGLSSVNDTLTPC